MSRKLPLALMDDISIVISLQVHVLYTHAHTHTHAKKMEIDGLHFSVADRQKIYLGIVYFMHGYVRVCLCVFVPSVVFHSDRSMLRASGREAHELCTLPSIAHQRQKD